MKVLFVSSGNVKGGLPTNLILAQGNSLINLGIDVKFFTIMGKGILGYWRNVRRIKQVLATEKYDVIHAHYGFCGIISFFAKTNEKLVNSLMGSDLLGEFPDTRLEKIRSDFFVFLTKFFSRYFYDFTIVKSKNLADQLWKKATYEIIPNGVDFTVFYPIDKKVAREKLSLPLDQKIVLFPTDSSRPEKNYKLAISACDLLKPDIYLRVVHGVSQEELNLNYNAADVVLLTSVYEGSPNVIKESLACNRVIVSTDVGDVKEHAGNTKGCFICSFEPVDLADKIKSALNFSTSEGRDNIGYLNSRVIAERIVKIYNQLIT